MGEKEGVLSISIYIKGKPVELPIEEARRLQATLNNLFKTNCVRPVPPWRWVDPLHDPYGAQPQWRVATKDSSAPEDIYG